MIRKLRRLYLQYRGYRLFYSTKIPNMYFDLKVETYSNIIDEDFKKEVRDWYIINLPNNIEIIKGSQMYDDRFGTRYRNATTKEWEGFYLSVGDDCYVKLTNEII